MFRFVSIATILLWCGASYAQIKSPPRAENLPQFDVMCSRAFTAAFEENGNDQIMEPAYDGEARFRLFTVNGLTLKIVRNPQSESLREEWAHFASEINISMISDPAKRPPFYGWREKRGTSNEVFSFDAGSKLLTRVNMAKGPLDRIISVEVMLCR